MMFSVLNFFLLLALATAQNYRLPETVIPSNYDIDIVVPEAVFNGSSKVFQGAVNITFQVNGSVTEVNLHHRNATIESLKLYDANSGVEVSIGNTSYVTTTQIFTIHLQSSLSTANTYRLQIIYSGYLEENAMNGFYISTFKNQSTGATEYMALTKFEPVHTRHAFPCLDDPQYKAIFQLSLTYPTGLNSLANTPANNSLTVNSTYTKTTFNPSTKMSSYLIAWSISSFTCTEGPTIETGVSHSVCSRSQESDHRAWAVDFGTSVMRTLESITGIKYGAYMQKMDQLAIPDFAAGAMENWGLVGYREAYLLWSENDSSNSYKKSVALTVAHEFTHMWFGNVVTCKWWDYLFLNEGFARFYQYFAAAATKQTLTWELEKHFIVEVTHVALLSDSSASAQSLTSAASTTTDILNKFSTITYSKGAGVLRMIEKNIMGADNFNYGIRNYLSSNKQQAATPANLWSGLSPYVPSNALPSGTTLSTVLNNWVELNGHPVVQVTRSGNDVILTQQRFLLSGNSTTTYYVPVTYTVSNDVTQFVNTTVKSWLIPGQSLTISNALVNSSWIILNNRQAGFYRVDYDSELWSSIISQLHSNHMAIDVLNRAQVISDLYNFARSGSQTGYGNKSFSDVMRLLAYLKNETEYYPWYAAIVGNNHLLLRLGHDSAIGKRFISWMLSLMQNVYQTVPFDTIDNSDQVYSMKQSLILTRVCKYQEASCISRSKELFAAYRESGTPVPKNLRSFVYCNALRHSDQASTDFNFLWQKFSSESLSTELLTILSGLGCSEDNASLKWLLGQSFNSSSGIRLQDLTSAWSYVYSSGNNGTNAALEYIAENYASISSAYSGVATLISGAAGYIYDESQLEKLEALYSLSGISASHNATVQSSLNTAKSNIAYAKSVATDIESFLDSQPSSALSFQTNLLLLLVLLLFSLSRFIC